MHHHSVELAFHPLQQLAYPALADSHPVGRLPLRHLLLALALAIPASRVPLGSFRFVPSFSLAAVNRNFLLWPIRNFSLWRDKMFPIVFLLTGICYNPQSDVRRSIRRVDPRRDEAGRGSS